MYLIFKRGLWSRVGYDGARTVFGTVGLTCHICCCAAQLLFQTWRTWAFISLILALAWKRPTLALFFESHQWPFLLLFSLLFLKWYFSSTFFFPSRIEEHWPVMNDWHVFQINNWCYFSNIDKWKGRNCCLSVQCQSLKVFWWIRHFFFCIKSTQKN